MRDYNQAEDLYLQALEIAEQKLGTNHPDTVLYRNNLQTLQDDQLCWCVLRNRLSQSQEPSQN